MTQDKALIGLLYSLLGPLYKTKPRPVSLYRAHAILPPPQSARSIRGKTVINIDTDDGAGYVRVDMCQDIKTLRC
jgi:hypothetical protein